ncbi:MAG: anti-sigma F factor [Lachnospiraceae bacterium]|nr:anti-sigma F factor [Lachnospiraceae bacterium]
MRNEIKMEFDAVSANEAFARVAVAALLTPFNPTLEEVADVKTAVSEAVTNAVIHAYDEEGGKVALRCILEDSKIHIEIEDYGKGIENIRQAMEPLFTTKPELDRSGMGFSFMEAFMDELDVTSRPGEGTLVTMEKKFAGQPYAAEEE